MDISLTVGSLIAITILSWVASRLYPVNKPLTASRVENNLLRYAPEVKIQSIVLSEDGQSALVKLDSPQGQFGLLHQLGDRVVCRIMSRSDVARLYWGHANLTVASSDFTQPQVSLVLTDQNRKQAEDLLEPIMQARETLNAA